MEKKQTKSKKIFYFNINNIKRERNDNIFFKKQNTNKQTNKQNQTKSKSIPAWQCPGCEVLPWWRQCSEEQLPLRCCQSHCNSLNPLGRLPLKYNHLKFYFIIKKSFLKEKFYRCYFVGKLSLLDMGVLPLMWLQWSPVRFSTLLVLQLLVKVALHCTVAAQCLHLKP